MKRFLLIAVSLVFLTGCDATLESKVANGRVETITLTLDEGLSDALRADPALDQQLYETFAELSSGKAIRDENDVITYRSEPRARPDASLTGVGGVSMVVGETTVTTLELVVPDRLKSAIDRATSDEPDAAALALAWQKSLRISVRVSAPGSVVSVANPDDLNVSVDGDVVITAPLDQWRAGSVRIESEPSSFPVLPVASAVIIAICGGLWLRRR